MEEDFGYLVKNEQAKPRMMIYVQDTGVVYMARCGVEAKVGLELGPNGKCRPIGSIEPHVRIEPIGLAKDLGRLVDDCKKVGLDCMIAPTDRDVRGAVLAYTHRFALQTKALEKLTEVLLPIYGIRP